MSITPSEFPTFYRLAFRSTLRSMPRRTFTMSTPRSGGLESGNVISDKGTQQDTSKSANGGNREHAIEKGERGDPNVQSEASARGRSSQAQDTGGSATRQMDERDSTAKAKEEHPEAPDVVIGMQDERGGKGV